MMKLFVNMTRIACPPTPTLHYYLQKGTAQVLQNIPESYYSLKSDRISSVGGMDRIWHSSSMSKKPFMAEYNSTSRKRMSMMSISVQRSSSIQDIPHQGATGFGGTSRPAWGTFGSCRKPRLGGRQFSWSALA